MRRFTVALALALGTIGLGPLPPAHAASILVTTFADDEDINGNCSLREATLAIEFTTQKDQCDASDPEADTIVLQAGTYTLTQPGAGENESANGDLDLVSMTIVGQGVGETVIDGNGGVTGDRVLHVLGGSTVSVRDLTVQHGQTTGTGAGIQVATGASLNLERVRVTANTGGYAAGIYNDGSATITDSTISQNEATGDHGGGLLNDTGATMTLVNSTVSGNTTTEMGGGITHFGVELRLTNVTISGNTADSSGGGMRASGPVTVLNNVTITGNTAGISAGGIFEFFDVGVEIENSVLAGNFDSSPSPHSPDCQGVLVSRGNNLIGDSSGCQIVGDTSGNIIGQDPNPGPLADNGGPTMTHALLQGSPAIDAGGPDCAATDQRGLPRNCDMGAYELVLCQKVPVNRIGTEGKDVLKGTAGSDGFLALGGNDGVRGLGGNDAACLGAGKDSANGGGGKDRLLGEGGKDLLRGAGGTDRLKGGPGKDRCVGGGGKDQAACEVERTVP